MSFEFTLQKVLQVRENEKQKAEKEYSKATKQFEEVATQLYELLKKKENYETDYYRKIEIGVPIFEMQQGHTLLSKLHKQINQLQYFTQKARENMNRKQEQLVEKSIELKKYEKIKQKKYELYIAKIKHEENILMDEISVQQFIKR